MIQNMLLAMLLLIPQTSNASEILEKGAVLKEDSVVFTIEEAEKLKQRMFELEKKEKLLEEYKELCSIKDKKIDIYAINQTFYEDQINTYRDMVSYQDEKINGLNKISKANDYRDAGYFVLGVAITVGSILLADKVNDSIQ